MNFEELYHLIRQYQYDEIRTIGKDTTLQGKPAHVAAIMRKGDQVELCLLMQNEPEKEKEMHAYPGKTIRDLMKQSGNFHNCPSIRQLDIDGLVLESRGASRGALHTGDPGGMHLLAKLMDAGWRLSEDHMFFRQDWEKQPVQLMHCRFYCASESLPGLEQAKKVRVTWDAKPLWYQIGKPVRLVTGDAAKDRDAQMEITFTLDGQDGTVQEGICYINRVVLQDMWEAEEQRFADPQMQKQMLEYMSQEEFMSMKRQSLETLGQMCPQGMCFPVVEYECTLDVSLEFYTQDYLNSPPACRSSSIMYLSKEDQEPGKHGLKLKSCILQTPVPPDTREVQAELFRAVRTVPEWEEALYF